MTSHCWAMLIILYSTKNYRCVCCVSAQSSCVIFLSLLQVNPVLKEVNLAYNGFADKGMTALADALKVNSTLCQLDVRLCMPHPLL